MKKLFIFLLIILSLSLIFFMVKIRPTYFPFTTIMKPTEPTADTYIEDLEFLNRVIKEHHPFLEVASATYKLDWDKEYSLAKEKVLTVTTTEDFEKIIEDLLSKLQNAHTLLMTDSDELAFSYYFYSNLGNKYDNHMIKKIRNPNTIAYYSLNNSQIKEFRKNGPQKFYDMRPYDNFSNKIIIPDKVAYAHVRTLLSESDKDYYMKNVKKIDEFTKQCKDYPIFILDIRYKRQWWR